MILAMNSRVVSSPYPTRMAIKSNIAEVTFLVIQMYQVIDQMGQPPWLGVVAIFPGSAQGRKLSPPYIAAIAKKPSIVELPQKYFVRVGPLSNPHACSYCT